MASKQTLLQGEEKSSASTPSVAATSHMKEVDYRIVCGWGPQGEDIVVDDGSASPKSEDFITITPRSSGGSSKVKCDATLQWRGCSAMDFHCVYDTKTGVFEDFKWTNKNMFGKKAGDDNGHIKDVSISMKKKSYNETGEAVEEEVLDDSDNRFLVVVMAFVSENETGTLYGKKVEGNFDSCFLSIEEKNRLQLD